MYLEDLYYLLRKKVKKQSAEMAETMYSVNSFSGATDNEKIVAAFNHMNSLDTEGATLHFPQRDTDYTLTTSVINNGKWNLKMDRAIVYNGDGIGITIQNAVRRHLEIMITNGAGYGSWFTGADLTSIGIKFDCVNFSEIILKDIRGFYKNVSFDNSDDKGSCYNNIFIGLIYDGFINLEFKECVVDGVTKSWNNSNNVFGGAIKISGAYAPLKSGTILINNEGNNNTIQGVSLEGELSETVLRTTAQSNIYINNRYELVPDNSIKFIGLNCYNNLLVMGYGLGSSKIQKDNGYSCIVIMNGQISGLNNTASFPGAPVDIDSFGGAENINSKTEGRSTFKVLPNGVIQLFHDISGAYPQIEIKGRYAQMNFGDGSAPTVNAFIVTAPGEAEIHNFIFSIMKDSSFYYEITTLPANAISFDISKGHFFVTANTIDTNISGITGGQNGKVIYLRCNDAHTTLAHGSGIYTKGKVSRVLEQDEICQFVRLDGGYLYEI